MRELAVRTAFELGAGAVRVASARRDERTEASMREAFTRGDLATWPYDRAYARKAAAPEGLLPGARCVICVAVPYATPPARPAPLSGRVSRYAWSRDYHRRVRAMLVQIAARIDAAAGGSVTAVACDTKPIAERAFAARAGLGWIGKHTNLIAPRLGSFVFLGEIVTTLDLALDEPLRTSCGSCSRCVAACPTAALRGDYTIDATRCIADLTQRKDGIPRELRPALGLWVWGCDICQEVCPPTQLAGESAALENRPLSEMTATPSLVDLLNLRSGEFARSFRDTAMGWRGAAVLRRNAAVALGNSLDRSAVPALREALGGDSHPMVRGHAAWALGRIASPAAIAALRSALASEADAGVREEISLALEPLWSENALERP